MTCSASLLSLLGGRATDGRDDEATLEDRTPLGAGLGRFPESPLAVVERDTVRARGWAFGGAGASTLFGGGGERYWLPAPGGSEHDAAGV